MFSLICGSSSIMYTCGHSLELTKTREAVQWEGEDVPVFQEDTKLLFLVSALS